MAAAGANSRKRDWSAAWREWIRRAGPRRARPIEEKRPDLFNRPKEGRTLAEIHRSFGEAWYAITQDTLRTYADDIDMAAAELAESDRVHFRSLVTAEVQSLCSPLAQAIAQGRSRPSFPYARLDLAALQRRTESQLHSTDGYEGRRNLGWWRERYPGLYGGGKAPWTPADLGLHRARELEERVVAFRNPNAFDNPNA